MEVCKNKSSGQFFIFIQEIGTEEALLINPEAQIKSLRINLFADTEDYPEEFLLNNKMITNEQIRKFNEYKKSKSVNTIENLLYDFEQMSSSEQKLFMKKIEEFLEKNK